MDQASDEREYEDEILAEIVELEAESEEDYQKKLMDYKKQLEEWKLWRRKQVQTHLPAVEPCHFLYQAPALFFNRYSHQHILHLSERQKEKEKKEEEKPGTGRHRGRRWRPGMQ